MWTKTNIKKPFYNDHQKILGIKDQYQQSSSNQSNSDEQNSSEKRKYKYSDSQSDNQSQHESEEIKNRQREQLSENSSQSEEQEDDSLDNDIKPKARKLEQLKEQSDEEEQSIDYIEERIRKLERDLQDRLDKHKSKIKQKNVIKKQIIPDTEESGKIVSIRKQPPVPPKKKQIQEDDSSSLPETQMNFKSKPINLDQQKDQRQKNNLVNKGNEKQSSKKQVCHQTLLQKKKQIKQNNSQLSNLPKKQSSSINSPKKVTKKSQKTIPAGQKSQFQPNKLSSIQKDLKKVNKQITQLKKQNKNLKQQLSYYKKKKRPIEEVEKLKQLSEHDTKKLEKEFELLKVLQRLQTKLKNSIQRKLGKGSSENKQIKQAALLHKGLPSNILN